MVQSLEGKKLAEEAEDCRTKDEVEEVGYCEMEEDAEEAFVAAGVEVLELGRNIITM